jgi:hypothetical protein
MNTADLWSVRRRWLGAVMGTDWVTLFNLDLAKEVSRLDARGLATFLARRGAGLAERDVRNATEKNAQLAAAAEAATKQMERALGMALPRRQEDHAGSSRLREEAVRRAAALWDDFAERLRRGDEIAPLRAEIAWAAGTMSNALNIDYWGCSATALSAFDIARTCETNLVIDPGDPDGPHVCFLLPHHVDAMISSLRAHWEKARVMDEADLQRLVEYRDLCASNAGMRVAYHVDF